ncbi:MAG: hypothetical protein EHM45_20440 [Desulfobacteraceae bacterium]|nr:MAG: hypothetical protein EHM45_20440 [Desulfobacteraceae bacterium]
MLKKITLSAEQSLIRKSREKARLGSTTLNKLFRQWLERYAKPNRLVSDYKHLMRKLSYGRGSSFRRDELNERCSIIYR